MSGIIGFGFFGMLPSDVSIIEKETIIKDFASQKWSHSFIEMVFDFSDNEEKLVHIYKGEIIGEEVHLTKLSIEENAELIGE